MFLDAQNWKVCLICLNNRNEECLRLIGKTGILFNPHSYRSHIVNFLILLIFHTLTNKWGIDMTGKRDKEESKSFNGLSPKEWAALSKSVWNDVSSPREWYHLEHGATFSVALAERAIKIYSKEGDTILDPFLGVGTTMIAARNLGRNGYGFELYEKFYNIAKSVLSQQKLQVSDHTTPHIEIYNDDCRNILKYIPKNTIQLTFTSPPYANFIYRSIKDRMKTHKNSILVTANRSTIKPYGNDPRDFGNLEYDSYLEEIKSLMEKIFVVTKPGGYNVWVVKDYRDPQNGKPLIPLHVDIAKAGEKAGFKWHDLIIWDQNAQRKLVVLGYPSVFYVNINHTFLVVLRKPPTKEG